MTYLKRLGVCCVGIVLMILSAGVARAQPSDSVYAGGSWSNIPDCPTAASGQHLNYSVATHTLSCGTGVTIPLLNSTNTWSGVQTFTNSDLALLGSSTGATTFTSANSGASNFTLTVPAITDTLVTATANQTLTNKSIAATEITGLAASATTDTTNASNITSGTLPAAQLPASSVQALTCSGSGCTFNTVTSADAKATMSQSDTITITNCSTSPWLSKRFVLEVAQNSTGGFTPTLAAGTGCGSLYWPNGTTPTPTLTLSKADIYGFWFDGTNLHGLLSQPNETP